MKKLLCPITNSELIYVGCDKGVMDGNSYYSPVSDNSIIFAVHPRANNVYVQVATANYNEKALRYFRLLDTDPRSTFSYPIWQELKRVPHGNELFPINQNDEEWKNSCADALKKYDEYITKCKYWDEHPEEDPRIKAKCVSIDTVTVVPLPPPTGILFYVDYVYNTTKEQ